MRRAHRVSYELVAGDIPDDLLVCHHCDNPPCVNPAHLFLGTVADNAVDAVAKGRWARGERSPMSKLTRDDVDEIRALFESGAFSKMDLSRRFGVSHTTIRRIVAGTTWRLP
jgi:hypothetical protein